MGGVAVVGGAALMFVPGGQVAGMGLMSFGGDVIIQKATTGEVNWGEAALSGAARLAGGGAGMIAGKIGAKVITNPVIREGVVNAVDGAVSGSVEYLTGPGPHTAGGLLTTVGVGAVTGGLPIKGAGKVSNVTEQLPTAGTRLRDIPPSVDRVKQDVHVNGTPPGALNPDKRTIGKTDSQNEAVQAEVARLKAARATDIRVDQQQVNAAGVRIGVNCPDLQYTMKVDGVDTRFYADWDRTSSNRGIAHEQRIRANDPDAGGVELITLD